MPSPAYFLAQHAFACFSGGSVVLLDLKADRYWALDARRACSLDGLVAGWPVPATTVRSPVAEAGARIAARLLERGLLTRDPAQGKVLRPPPVAVPVDAATGPIAAGDMPLRLQHLLSFGVALTRAWLHLRCRSMAWIVDYVRRRRANIVTRGCQDEAMRQSARVFDRLRSFTYDAHDACLFDSLAMLYFLLRQGCQPQWVIGVRSSPSFMAHSWLQHGDTVLNDSVDHVSVYTPIMAA